MPGQHLPQAQQAVLPAGLLIGAIARQNLFERRLVVGTDRQIAEIVFNAACIIAHRDSIRRHHLKDAAGNHRLCLAGGIHIDAIGIAFVGNIDLRRIELA